MDIFRYLHLEETHGVRLKESEASVENGCWVEKGVTQPFCVERFKVGGGKC